MSATIPVQAQLVESVVAPPIVYFWGPVRSHVNKVASEYARRLAAEPVVLDVQASGTADEERPDEEIGPYPRFVLKAGQDVQLLPSSEQPAIDSGEETGQVSDLEREVSLVLKFPWVVHSALRAASRIGPQSAFVLSNIDRLQHLYPLFQHGMGDALFRAFRQRGIVLILTSKNLLPLPRLEFECAFEVSSAPDQDWWEAEVRPGVPVSCCVDCPSGSGGLYGACSPIFQVACPVQEPLTLGTH
ncbi:MAG TPA: hypothetical protein VJS68_02280 [Thermoplasmata archaeon]|nr:hypothetical protein [Thermoplasmata archaeon]